jgi:hypothetical protein
VSERVRAMGKRGNRAPGAGNECAHDDDDFLDLTLRVVLRRLLGTDSGRAAESSAWIDIKSEACPVAAQQVREASKRGELRLSKIGRSLLVKRTELEDWFERRACTGRMRETKRPKSDAELVLLRTGWRKDE